jgi:hypothetical protein
VNTITLLSSFRTRAGKIHRVSTHDSDGGKKPCLGRARIVSRILYVELPVIISGTCLCSAPSAPLVGVLFRLTTRGFGDSESSHTNVALAAEKPSDTRQVDKVSSN